jgi:hypothetical protein
MKLLLKCFTEISLKNNDSPIPIYIPISTLSNFVLKDNENIILNLIKSSAGLILI